MATTVTAAFNDYQANLEITNRQERLVGTTRAGVVACLANKLAVMNSLLTGSYDRQTMIRYLREGDIDVFVLLDGRTHADWNNGPGTIRALDRFRGLLSDCYPTTPLRRDWFCITMTFSEFKMDVVPSFQVVGGGYLIPDSVKQQWTRTDPIAFCERITAQNKRLGGRVIPLIKMIKGWNRDKGWKMKSFHLEVLMLRHVSALYSIPAYPQAVTDFFAFAKTALLSTAHDPIYGAQIDDYLDNQVTPPNLTNRQLLIASVTDAHAKAKDALQYAEMPTTAIPKWKKIFGEFFPTYG